MQTTETVMPRCFTCARVSCDKISSKRLTH